MSTLHSSQTVFLSSRKADGDNPISWVSPSKGSTYATNDKIVAKWKLTDDSQSLTSSPAIQICRNYSFRPAGWHSARDNTAECGPRIFPVLVKGKGNYRSASLRVPKVASDGTYVLRMEDDNTGLTSSSPPFSFIAKTISRAALQDDKQTPLGVLPPPLNLSMTEAPGRDAQTNANTLPEIPQLLVNNKPTDAKIALVTIPLAIVAFVVLAFIVGLCIRRRHQPLTLARDDQRDGTDPRRSEPQLMLEQVDEEKAGVLVPHPVFMPVELYDLPRLPKKSLSWTTILSSSTPTTSPARPPVHVQSQSFTFGSDGPGRSKNILTTRPTSPPSNQYTLPPIPITPITSHIANNDRLFDDVQLQSPHVNNRRDKVPPVIDYFQPSAPYCSEVFVSPPPRTYSLDSRSSHLISPA